MKANCPLCTTLSREFYKKINIYYKCEHCHSIFVDENNRIDLESEKLVYQQHENNVEDKNYQKFVSPITNAIIKDFLPTAKGLDFGAGTAPVVSKVLQDKSYEIKQYDPFFHNTPKVIESKYDFIASCEVIEHFFNPYKEFGLFKNMLHKNGKIYLMTEIYHEGIDFASWYYKNDPTHVFFYTKESFEWIKNEFGFSTVTIEKRLIIFEN